VNETDLAHDVRGAGPALVLLHSGVCDRRMWEPQFSAFADAGYRVVGCDIRGYGDSPAPDRPNNDADDVLALLGGLGVETFTIVGSSYGGKIGLEIAARQPDRVRALALLCSGMRGDVEGAVAANVENWLGPDADAATRDLVARMQKRAFDLQLAAPEFEQTMVDVELSAIADTPVLAVWGGKDLPDFRQIAEHLAATLPNTRALELSWAGHLPSLERPEETFEILAEFLALVHSDDTPTV
jgi:3-oxoadipate enol-lactonase